MWERYFKTTFRFCFSRMLETHYRSIGVFAWHAMYFSACICNPKRKIMYYIFRNSLICQCCDVVFNSTFICIVYYIYMSVLSNIYIYIRIIVCFLVRRQNLKVKVSLPHAKFMPRVFKNKLNLKLFKTNWSWMNNTQNWCHRVNLLQTLN